MSLNKSLTAYPDIQANMDRALASEKGIKITFTDPKDTKRYLQRANFFRKLQRDKNKLLYPDPGHQYHHESIYDALIIRMSKDRLTIFFEKAETSIEMSVDEL